MKAILLAIVFTIALGGTACGQFTTAIYREESTNGLYAPSTTISPAGDVNNDGIPDLILGSFDHPIPSTTPATVQVLSGADGSIIYQLSNETPGSLFGFSVSDVGDINGDGFDDFIVGDPNDSTASTGSGVAKVYSGCDGSVLFATFGAGQVTRTGLTTCGLGDLNNDGFDDFAVSETKTTTPLGTPASRLVVRVFSGADLTQMFEVLGPMSTGIPTEMSNAGDVNGDGTNDIVVGIPQGFGVDQQNPHGTVLVLSGVNGNILHQFNGPTTSSFFGQTVDGIGDVDNDGFDDLIVGEHGYFSTGPTPAGRIWIYSGADGSVIRTHVGTSGTAATGANAAGVGDIDGDGTGDYAFAQADASDPFVILYSGATGQSLGTLPSPPLPQDYIQRVSRIGDLNADGKDDVIVGSFLRGFFQNGESNEGEIRVYLSGVDPVSSYASQSGQNAAMALSWLPEAGHVNNANGALICNGATPGGFGLVLGSLAPADIPILGFDLLVAVDPINLLLTATMGADFGGHFIAGGISRRNPFIAGSAIHVQFIETHPVIRASNAIKFIPIP